MLAMEEERHSIPIRSGEGASASPVEAGGVLARRPGVGWPNREVLLRAPLVDIHESEAGLLLEADVPGTSEKGLTIHLEHNVLSLRARVETTVPEGAKPLDQEYQPLDFERSFILSDEVDRGRITAELRDGVLKVWMPRAEKSVTRVIEVRTD